MANSYQVKGSITLEIGKAEVTLKSGDLGRSPFVYRMDEGQKVQGTFTDIANWLDKTLHAGITIPESITEGLGTISVGGVYVSSAGDLELTVETVAGADGKGWNLFGELKVKSTKLEFKRIPEPVISAANPKSLAAGQKIALGGTGLKDVKKVKIGDTEIQGADLKTDNNFIEFSIPATAKAGAAAIVVTGADNKPVHFADGTTVTIV